MWSAIVECLECGYQSKSFADGYDIHEGIYNSIFVDDSTGVLRIEEFSMEQLEALGVDSETGTGLDAALDALTRKGETRIVTPFGQDMLIDAICPDCKHRGLIRRIHGMI